MRVASQLETLLMIVVCNTCVSISSRSHVAQQWFQSERLPRMLVTKSGSENGTPPPSIPTTYLVFCPLLHDSNLGYTSFLDKPLHIPGISWFLSFPIFLGHNFWGMANVLIHCRTWCFMHVPFLHVPMIGPALRRASTPRDETRRAWVESTSYFCGMMWINGVYLTKVIYIIHIIYPGFI